MKWFAIACALFVALCWGMYGPTLSNARSPSRDWGPFKPYVFIGVAYLVLAIIGGSIMMKFAFNDNFDYTGKYFPAAKWGFLAGCLGALGALGLTFALTKAGGKPSYVMPIVFGGAVAVNAIAHAVTNSGKSNPLMYLGMFLVAAGIILTAKYTNWGHGPKKPAEAHATSHADDKPGAGTSPMLIEREDMVAPEPDSDR